MMSYDHYPVEMDFVEEEAVLPDYCETPIPRPVTPDADQVADDMYGFMGDLFATETDEDLIYAFIPAAHYVIRHQAAQLFLFDHMPIARALYAFCTYLEPRAPSISSTIYQLQFILYDISLL